jgi:hypothetical protein
MVQIKQNSEVVAKKGIVVMLNNTFFWPQLHYFVYSVPFNIIPIPFFGLNFTILFILYHLTLLHLYLVSKTGIVVMLNGTE